VIDSLRTRYPHLGLAVYAIVPGGVVTVEVFTPDGSVISKQAPTEREAIELLFGPDVHETQEEDTDADGTDTPEPDDIFS
jgi:hypothetical protein